MPFSVTGTLSGSIASLLIGLGAGQRRYYEGLGQNAVYYGIVEEGDTAVPRYGKSRNIIWPPCDGDLPVSPAFGDTQ